MKISYFLDSSQHVKARRLTHLAEFMFECTVIVGTTILFVAHTYGFLCSFKQWELNSLITSRFTARFSYTF
jgi:hypothetical protein